MIETSNPAIDIKALMSRIQEEIGRHSLERVSRRGVGFKRLSAVELPRLAGKRQPDTGKSIYHLDALLASYDEAFVNTAYEALLKRKADRQGKKHFLEQLRSGRFNRIEVLGRLRYSREGREKAVSVEGLLPAFARASLFKVPLFGPLFEFVVVLARLPARLRHLLHLHEQTATRMAEIERQFNLLSQQSETAVNRLIDELNRRD